MNRKVKIIFSFILTIIIFFAIFKNHNWFIEFINSLNKSFYRTLIEEDRYVLILEGLKSTLIISLFSIIFGTFLGSILFLLKKSKIKIFNILSSIVVNILQGTPVTVLLLIFYYVIFGTININPIMVAIITFSVYFSAYVSEIFSGAYASINKAQIYSAYSMGFTKFQTLKYVILPQVLAYVIPVFKNESVSLIKSTSIAGYISIMELTKASDIIRYRTYEAFFPLILTAIIYFLICLTISKILDFAYKKIDSRAVKRA